MGLASVKGVRCSRERGRDRLALAGVHLDYHPIEHQSPCRDLLVGRLEFHCFRDGRLADRVIEARGQRNVRNVLGGAFPIDEIHRLRDDSGRLVETVRGFAVLGNVGVAVPVLERPPCADTPSHRFVDERRALDQRLLVARELASSDGVGPGAKIHVRLTRKIGAPNTRHELARLATGPAACACTLPTVLRSRGSRRVEGNGVLQDGGLLVPYGVRPSDAAACWKHGSSSGYWMR